jgi:hypothetical protein
MVHGNYLLSSELKGWCSYIQTGTFIDLKPSASGWTSWQCPKMVRLGAQPR